MLAALRLKPDSLTLRRCVSYAKPRGSRSSDTRRNRAMPGSCPGAALLWCPRLGSSRREEGRTVDAYSSIAGPPCSARATRNA